MTIVFYSAPDSSAIPVACALAELDVPHETITLDLKAGDQKKPEFLALNPNGKVPTLVVDGTPMFEALAIMQWLGDRYGVDKKLWPAPDSAQRLTAMSWSTWVYVTVGATIAQLNFARSPMVPPELHSTSQAAYADKELQRLFGLLDARLQPRPHILGEAFSLVDLIAVNVVLYTEICGISTGGHSHLKAWLDRCRERPSIKAPWTD